MSPPYKTPQDAVTGLIEAYRTFDVDQIVQSKDFDIDAQLFWDDLGLPVSPEQQAKSRLAFEKNFRNQMKERMPDYRSVSFRLVSEERPRENFVIITLAGATPENQAFELRILSSTLTTDGKWCCIPHMIVCEWHDKTAA